MPQLPSEQKELHPFQLRRLGSNRLAVGTYARRLALSFDGSVLASVSGPLMVWDVPKGERIFVSWLDPDCASNQVAFSSDGIRIATGGFHSVHVFRKDPDWQLERVLVSAGSVSYLAFSPDGQTLLSSGSLGTVLWDLTTGCEVTRLKATGAVAYSSDGHLIACPCSIWDMRTQRQVGPFKTALSCAMTFSPDASLVCSGDMKGEISVWDVATGNLVSRMKHGDSIVRSLVWTESELLSLTDSLHVWDPTSLTTSPKTTRVLKAAGQQQTLSGNGKFFALVDGEYAVVRSCLDRHAISPDPPSNGRSVTHVVASPGGDRALTFSSPRYTTLWDDSGVPLFSRTDWNCPWFSRDGQSLLVYDDHTHTTTSHLIAPLVHKECPPPQPMWPDTVWPSSEDWWLERAVKLSRRHPGGIIRWEADVGDGYPVISDGGQVVAWVKTDRQNFPIGVTYIDGDTGRILGTQPLRRAQEDLLALSEDGKMAAVGVKGGVKIFTVSAHGTVSKVKVASRPVAAFSPDAEWLAMGHGFGVVSLAKVSSGKTILEQSAHVAHVTSIGFSKDGRRLVSGSADTTVVVWDFEAMVRACSQTANRPGPKRPPKT